MPGQFRSIGLWASFAVKIPNAVTVRCDSVREDISGKYQIQHVPHLPLPTQEETPDQGLSLFHHGDLRRTQVLGEGKIMCIERIVKMLYLQ